MSAEIIMPIVIGVCAAGAWFISMVAGAWATVGSREPSAKAMMWYGCSVAATEFVTISAWVIGRHFPIHN